MVKRNTIQRQLVIAAVHKHGHHPTAEEIYDMITEDYPDISKGTVYRNLASLLESGVLSKVPVSGGADRYDHILSKHYHVHCSNCGEIVDLRQIPYDYNLDKQVEETSGYILESHDIVFSGICPKCQAAAANEKVDHK